MALALVPRVWTLRDFLLAVFFVLGLSLGFIALFPYDTVILGPMTGVGGFAGLQLLILAASWLLYMRARHTRWTDAGAVLLWATAALSIVLLRVQWTAAIDPLADRDEALDVAWHGLIAGVGPYVQPTPLGNPISPLMGGILLFGPFELLGLTEVFDVISLVIVGVVLVRVIGIRPTGALAAVLFASAAFRWEVVIESDGWINAAYVGLGVVWAAAAIRRPLHGWRSSLNVAASSIFLSTAIAYRIHFAIVLVPLLIWALRSVGRARALAWVIGVLSFATALALAPLLAWPAPFGPQHVSEFLPSRQVGGIVVLAGLCMAAALLWLLSRVRSIEDVLRWTALSIMGAFFLLGFSQVDWEAIGQAPLAAFTGYPPLFLKSFGTYALTANNGGVLFLGLLALTLPRGYLSSVKEEPPVASATQPDSDLCSRP